MIAKKPEFHFILIPENEKEYSALMLFQKAIADQLKGIAQVTTIIDPPLAPTSSAPPIITSNTVPDLFASPDLVAVLDTWPWTAPKPPKGSQGARLADVELNETTKEFIDALKLANVEKISSGKTKWTPVGGFIYVINDEYTWVNRVKSKWIK